MTTVHQIIIVDGMKIPDMRTNPVAMNRSMQSVNVMYGQHDYHLWSGEECIEFIHSNFDKEVLTTFHRLNAYANKADLARACILYLQGGFYTDIFIEWLQPIDFALLNQFDFCAFRDQSKFNYRFLSVLNGIQLTKPRCKVLEEHIKLIIQNSKNEYYGYPQPTAISGPVALGRSIARAIETGFDEQRIGLIGDIINLTVGYGKENFGFVANNGDILALRTKVNNMNQMGLTGANDYYTIYCEGQIYNKEVTYDT
jgi:hypothetical protein